MATAKRYLPFDRYHIAAEIGDLTPDALKLAAEHVRDVYRGDAPFQQVTALNHMAKTMGFKVFNGFKTDYEKMLPRFMEKHGLRYRRDVLSAPFMDAAIRLDYRQVADRLFASNKQAPKAIFVGANTEYWDLLKAASLRDDMKVVSQFDRTSFENAVSVVPDTSIPPGHYTILNRDGALPVIEFGLFQNVIGDQLCALSSGSLENAVACIYESGGAVPEESRSRLSHAARILRELIASCPSGWVKVIPYNDRLCFLKAPDGGYEFVFKKLRTTPFTSDLLGDPRLNNFPFHFDETEQFTVWSYFKYTGWQERDYHLAETEFYEGGGTLTTYPGLDAICREHFKKTGEFKVKKMTAVPVGGFTVVRCGGQKMCVSELVTVADFNRYMKETTYSRRRSRIKGIESWEPANHMDDAHLPAAVTWHDAKAYAHWFGRINKLPIRLATEREYLTLTAGLIPKTVSEADVINAHDRQLGRFYNPEGIRFERGHPDYMNPGEFNRWGFRYDPSAIEWAETEYGLKVLQSFWFGEWLMPKGAAINSLFFCSQSDVLTAPRMRISAERGGFLPISTGKYKSMKIGFRLVYEADVDGGD